MSRLSATLLKVLCGLLLTAATARAGDAWPAFRGPTGLGYSDETSLAVKWGGDGQQNVLWKAALPGEGHGSPIVWKDRIFVVTVFWPPKNEPVASVIPEQHLTCFSVADGKQLWDTQIPKGPWIRNDFRSGPGGGYAGPTPATDGERVYCVFGSSVIAALNFDGKLLWSTPIVPFSFDVTIGASPVLFGGNVLMFCASSNPKDTRLAAYDKASGKLAWAAPIPHMGFSHSTPTLLQGGAHPQLIVVGGGMGASDEALQALDPTDGTQLWWCRGAGESASIAYQDELLYFDSGRGSPGEMIRVDPASRGDVSGTAIKWTVPNVPEAIGSPIIVNGCVYRLCAPGVLRCWDAETGKTLFTQRLEGISTTWASPIADAAGHIFFASAGKSYVIKASRTYEEIAVNDLLDANHPSPAVANGRMFLEGTKYLWCVGAKR